MSDDHEATSAMNFIFEAGVLKRAARTGWWFAGVKHPESIAEHSFRTALIGMMLAAMEGAVVARDADKLECLVQAVEYRHQGTDNVQRWIDSSRAALKTASAHRLADAALAGQPLTWLNPPTQQQ
jgi:5'-deoxynucleotidase YfbR-like HD superfamily hydrolase